jgi:hypothetical protein
MRHRRLFLYSAESPKISTLRKVDYKRYLVAFRSDTFWFRDRELWYGTDQRLEIKKYLSYYNMLYSTNVTEHEFYQRQRSDVLPRTGV